MAPRAWLTECSECRRRKRLLSAATAVSRGTGRSMTLAPQPATIPHQLADVLSERYSIERELGRGGMAIVYLAHDVPNRRQVAIKVMRPEVADALGAERVGDLRSHDLDGHLPAIGHVVS